MPVHQYSVHTNHRDAPNAWPPHQFIVLEALRQLPSNITTSTLPLPPSNQSSFGLIPSGQIGLQEDQLPSQAITPSVNNTKTGPGADLNRLNGTVVNGGNATNGEGWARTLQRELANRYIASALCSWYVSLNFQGCLSNMTRMHQACNGWRNPWASSETFSRGVERDPECQ